MVGCKFYIKKNNNTDWLNTLLQQEFFSSCYHHQEFGKNEKNLFCIDCNVEFCKHCITAHCVHRRLQIFKYVYHDVVRLQEIQKYLDCSKIQTYKINGEKAVHLNPRPRSKDTKPSTKSKCAASCEACGRYIQDQPNRFCSIACKVSVVSMQPLDQSHHKIFTVPIPQFGDLSLKESYNSETETSEMESSLSLSESVEEVHAWVSAALKPRKLLHKRKGIPLRAPFC